MPFKLSHTGPTSSLMDRACTEGQAMFFTIDLNGQEVMIMIQNSNFLSQIILEGMKLAVENYLNHLWLNNIMNPLAPMVAPSLHHNMQQHWGLPSHFIPLLTPMINQKLPFFSPMEFSPKNPLLFPWIPQLPLEMTPPTMPISTEISQVNPIWKQKEFH